MSTSIKRGDDDATAATELAANALAASAIPSDHDIVHSLPDDLPVGLWVARAPGGEFVYANHEFAAIMGTTPRDDVRVGEYSAPYGIFTREGEPYPEERLPFVRALRERRVVVVDDLTIHRRDGTRVDVRAFARPVSDGRGGEVTHVVIAFFDITREVAAERAQAESDRRLHLAQRLEAVGTLAGGVAHDFNNLVLGIKLLAGQVAATEPDAQRREQLAMIDEITERAAALTRSILSFARHGRRRAEPVALNAVAAAMTDMLRRTLIGVEIATDLAAAGGGMVAGDHAQLEQVIMNLVVNARDALAAERGDAASGGARRVLVRTRDEVLDGPPPGAVGPVRAGRHVVLEVSDNGPGIPLEMRERVFEPYFTTKEQGGVRGTGLGLATVFGVAQGHGGGVAIGDGLAGRGATLRVYLPALPGDAQPPPTAQAPTAAAAHRADVTAPGDAQGGAHEPVRAAPSSGERRRGTVLVVDDEPTVRRLLALTLAGHGYEALQASSGAEAVALYRERGAAIDVVLLDMIMPQMDGRATYEALRALDPDVAVLLISGYTRDEDVRSVLELGVRGLLPKPCSEEQLVATVASVLARARAR